MTYIDPRSGETLDTWKQPIATLCSLVLFLKGHPAASGFMKANGPDADVRIVRALRARLFKEKDSGKGAVLAAMNAIDPPRCRCGRPGTRIVAAHTFCSSCGPNATMARRLTTRQKALEVKNADIAYKKKDRDYMTLDHKTLKETKKYHRRVKSGVL